MTSLCEGQVIAAFGRHLIVRVADGTLLRARIFGRDLDAVCGDRVSCRLDAHHDEAHAVAVLPRRTALWRTSQRGDAEAVAANLTRLIVVLAPLPRPDFFVVDRYLAAASSAAIEATLVLNKSELGTEALAGELAAWAGAGYPVIVCSAVTGAGLTQLRAALPAGTLAAFVGQSGVGKSSLVRSLVPGADAAVGELARADEGRHTTTAARLYDLPGGAALIDAPGVRDFAPAMGVLEERALGFPEIGRLAAGCRFADCRHLREPDCAVRTAAEAGDGALSARRYESYRRLRRLRERLLEARREARRR